MSRRKPATATTAPAPIAAPAIAPGEIWAAVLPAAALRRLIAAALPATAPGKPDPYRLWPSCLVLLAEAGIAGLRVAATDGHLLAVAEAPAGLALTAGPRPVLVAAAEAKRLIAAMRDAVKAGADARLAVTDDAVVLDVPGARVTAPRTADDGWPAHYAQVVPARRSSDDPVEQPGATYWAAPILARVAACAEGYGATSSDRIRLSMPDQDLGPLRADVGIGGDGLTVVAMPMRGPARDDKPITGAA